MIKVKNVPRRSSPKLPHPIFLPTRKFGPTISTLDDVEVDGLLDAALDACTPADAVLTAAIMAFEFNFTYGTQTISQRPIHE